MDARCAPIESGLATRARSRRCCARALARRKMGRANACRVLIGCLRIGRIMKHRLLPPATLRARSKR